MEQTYCHDCGKELKEEEGKRLVYQDGDKKITIYKCDECFKKSKALRNFRESEVYSRVVGYLRPVQQWNAGKQAEYNERKVFKQTE